MADRGAPTLIFLQALILGLAAYPPPGAGLLVDAISCRFRLRRVREAQSDVFNGDVAKLGGGQGIDQGTRQQFTESLSRVSGAVAGKNNGELVVCRVELGVSPACEGVDSCLHSRLGAGRGAFSGPESEGADVLPAAEESQFD